MERDDDSGGNEHSFGVERASAHDVAAVERQFDAGYLTTAFVVATSGLVEQPLNDILC